LDPASLARAGGTWLDDDSAESFFEVRVDGIFFDIGLVLARITEKITNDSLLRQTRLP